MAFKKRLRVRTGGLRAFLAEHNLVEHEHLKPLLEQAERMSRAMHVHMAIAGRDETYKDYVRDLNQIISKIDNLTGYVRGKPKAPPAMDDVH